MPVESAPVTFVETSEEAAQFISWLGERRPILAIDTETEGLRLFSGDKVRLVQFGDSQSAWVLSARRWYGAIEEALKKYQEPTAWANANFDLHALEIAGLPLPGGPHNRHDIQVMDHLLDPARSHALKKIGDRMWPGSSAGQEALDAEMRRGKWDWATIPEDNLAYWNYAGFDVVLTSRIAEVHWPAVNARGLRPAYDREMAVQEIVRRMEHRGLLIDEVYTASLLEKWQYEREELRLELEALGVGNPSAGLQVAQAMQATENWDPEDWTETGLPKLDEKILKGIDSEISRRVLRYRRLTKWCKAYLMSFLERKGTDGRIHPSIHSLRARTGRWSITDPPLQTLPSAKSGGTGGYDIRRCIIVPESDRLWTVDYDSQELRIFASLSGDPALIHAFESGQDLHSYVAQLVYRDESIAKGDIRREIAKNTQYARLYGAGPSRIAETAHVTEAEVANFIDTYDRTFTKAGDFIKDLDRIGRERLAESGRPYVFSIGGRYIPANQDKIYSLLNYLIQGSAKDILSMKLIELDAAGYGDNIVLAVHDELLFEFDAEDEDSPRAVARIMEDRTTYAVPLTCEATGPYPDWGTKYAKH